MRNKGITPATSASTISHPAAPSRVFQWFVGLLLIALVATGCTTGQNPLSGRERLYGYTWEQEEQIGRESDQAIQQQFGVYDDQALRSYIERIAQPLVDVSHIRRPETDERIRQTEFVFRVLDSDVPNAMALPGGYIYVTRGLLSHLNNEAQLAMVVGHEIGHVAGRHASRRAAEQQLTQLGLIGAALGGEALGLPGGTILEAGSVGAELLFLRYSRDDEREADRVGVEYAALEGYRAHEGSEFFRSLQRLQAQQDGDIPNFLATHPDPGDREQAIVRMANEWEQETEMTRVGTEQYMQQIDGMVMGENPRQGFVEGNRFYHPDLEFHFPVPRNFQLQNQPTAVVMVEANQRAQMALQIVYDVNSTREALQRVLAQDGIQVLDQGTTTSNNIPARYAVIEGQTQQGGRVRALLYFLDYGGRIYGFQAMAAPQNYSQFESAFVQTAQGFQRLTDQRILNIQPTRVSVHRTQRSAPFRDFVNEAALPGDMTVQELAIMNQVSVDEQIEAGQLLKLPSN